MSHVRAGMGECEGGDGTDVRVGMGECVRVGMGRV